MTTGVIRHSKEKLRAIKKLEECWTPFLTNNTPPEPVVSDNNGMFFTGFTAFSQNKIELKGSDGWRWNQSIANIDFQLDPNIQVLMYKLNSRRKVSGVGYLPSYKVWVYQMYINHSKTPSLYFMWCEKGLPQLPYNPSEITIQDLSFLKAFTTQEVANFLGW